MEFRNKIFCGDALDVLKTFPNECIDTVITSPPYWKLRQYEHPGQLGQEDTFREFVHNLIGYFVEVKRVLKSTGSLWVNLGDTMSTQGGFNTKNAKKMNTDYESMYMKNKMIGVPLVKSKELPGKCLCMIPARFVIEMIDNCGWILRNEVIWKKTNPMPESMRDRFTRDFESFFFFVKSKKYYFKRQFEDLKESTRERYEYDEYAEERKKDRKSVYNSSSEKNMLNPRTYDKMVDRGLILGRNKRAVWELPTGYYKEAHFAIFPAGLVEMPLESTCPMKVCSLCGSPVNIVFDVKTLERFELPLDHPGHRGKRYSGKYIKGQRYQAIKTIEERPGCSCNARKISGVVLDPFCGSGTVLETARRKGLDYVGIDIKKEYVEMSERRLGGMEKGSPMERLLRQ